MTTQSEDNINYDTVNTNNLNTLNTIHTITSEELELIDTDDNSAEKINLLRLSKELDLKWKQIEDEYNNSLKNNEENYNNDLLNEGNNKLIKIIGDVIRDYIENNEFPEKQNLLLDFNKYLDQKDEILKAIKYNNLNRNKKSVDEVMAKKKIPIKIERKLFSIEELKNSKVLRKDKSKSKDKSNILKLIKLNSSFRQPGDKIMSQKELNNFKNSILNNHLHLSK